MRIKIKPSFRLLPINSSGYFFALVFLLLSQAVQAMVELKDEQLADVTGQALLQMNKEFTNGYTFYKAGLDAELRLNMNIDKLQLGCGGINGTDGCDLDIDNFSLGCVANNSGQCITQNPASGSIQKPGLLRDCGNGTCTGTNIDKTIQQQMLDFVINRPFFQFAIQNDDDKTLREVVGIRMGGENVSGPMSFGALNQFSGYMSGEADVFMQGETDVSPVSYANARYQNASAFMGLQNDEIVNILGFKIDYRDLTMDYAGQSRENVSAEVTGNRLSKILIPDLRLADLVDDIVNSVAVNRICVRGWFGGCSVLSNPAIADALMPALRGGISDYIKDQLAGGLGINVNNLNTYALPYNLTNIHQLDVSTPLFGLSFQKEDVRYPGYESAVPRGWSMYAPDAFNLVINDQVSSFVQAIAGSSDARDGNVVGLEAPYRNCWGAARFC